MKFIFISLLIAISSFSFQSDTCGDLKFDIEVTHTSGGIGNGIIDVTIIKSSSKAMAYLYGDEKSKNKLNIDPDQLNKLKAGTYMLVLQNDQCYAVKRDIIIK